ncbi:MAG TPA: purine-nucleoside phosphorylase [Candidatus Limnocylindrales bacterium]|nr:purine-nucleoside phosphorylase [Candidatus Limnocylindrales bacterium]
MTTSADYEKAAAVIRQRTTLSARVGIVLGSGLGSLADELHDSVTIPYAEIPGWPQSTVPGHSGTLVLGTLESVPVLLQRGRAHFYEGYTPQQVTFPIRVMHALGVETVILTNAAGGINPAYHVGDVMLLNDHLNLVGMTGLNPLMGPNDDALGERFPGMSGAYDRELRQLAKAAAEASGVPLHEGVYAWLSGPNFETPAEIRMLRMLGADAVGMSTVPEVLVARHMRMRVMAMSGITNAAIASIDSNMEATHEEVLESGKLLAPRMASIMRGVLRALD